MKEVMIKYNPYKVETFVTIDHDPVKENSVFNVGDRRLQEWVEKLPEWLYKECNTKKIHLIFHGTQPDYEDVLSVLDDDNLKKKGYEFEFVHIPAKEVEDKEKQIKEIFDEIQKGPFEELKQPDVINAFENAQNSEFHVSVVATMSAGKSTLINALLHQKLMPLKQEACTATITEIKDNDQFPFRADVYDKDGNKLESTENLTYKEMERFNDDEKVSRIKAEGNIPFVDANDVNLVLEDTPGPNNSRNQEHKEATYRMLSESSKTLVLYILNAGQFAINDDNNLLNHVAKSMEVNGKQSKDRFIFVVNKLDDFRKGEDNVEDTLLKMRKYLEGKGIKNPNIYPASALTALDIRTKLKDQRIVGYTEEELDELDVSEFIFKVKTINKREDMHLEKYAPLTQSMKEEIESRRNTAEEKTAKINDAMTRSEGMKELALIHSGIVPIEDAIRIYVKKYAKTAKIKNIVDTFAKKLEDQKSFERAKQSIAASEDERNRIEKQIEQLEKNKNDGLEAEKFKKVLEAVDFTKDVDNQIKKIITETQTRMAEKQSSVKSVEISPNEAKQMGHEFEIFTRDIFAATNVELQNTIVQSLKKQADKYLTDYKIRLASLADDVGDSEITIKPLELIQGDIAAIDVEDMISQITKTREKSVENGGHYEPHWYNHIPFFGDFFDEEWVPDYKSITVSYLDAATFARQFFTPIDKKIRQKRPELKSYVEREAKRIQDQFENKFVELDQVLDKKLQELKEVAEDKENVEIQLQKANENLSWLEDIQNKVNGILDI